MERGATPRVSVCARVPVVINWDHAEPATRRLRVRFPVGTFGLWGNRLSCEASNFAIWVQFPVIRLPTFAIWLGLNAKLIIYQHQIMYMVMSRQERGRLGGLKGRISAIQHGKECESRYNENPKFCKYCGLIVDYSHRINDFCDRACAARYNNNLNFPDVFESSLPTCLWCGKKLSEKDHRICRKGSCRTMYNVSMFLSGKPTLSGRLPRSQTIRKYYINVRGHRCEECMLTSWANQPIPLELHHKNGDSRDHTSENVKLLCRNCHAFTSTFGSKSGHKSTRKRLYTLV